MVCPGSQYARQVISDVTQRFEPTMFWTQRQHLAAEMEAALGRVMLHDGGADLVSLQLMRTYAMRHLHLQLLDFVWSAV